MSDETEARTVRVQRRVGPAPLPIGTRIRFTHTLIEEATGDHPALLFARKGEGGVVTGHNNSEGYWVKWDGWPHEFGASLQEFEPVPPNDGLSGPRSGSVLNELLCEIARKGSTDAG